MEIRPFSCDYSDLLELVRRAWPAEHKGYLDYTEKDLEDIFQAPDTDPRLTLGAYRNGKLVAFLLSKRKRLAIHGREYLGLFNTLASTHPDHAHLFPYLRLKERCIEKAVDRGYRLNFGFVAEGIKNGSIESLYARRKGFHCCRVHSFSSLMAPETEDGPSPPLRDASESLDGLTIRPFRESDTDRCLEIVRDAVARCPVHEKWDRASFLHHFIRRAGSFARVVEREGRVEALAGCLGAVMNYRRFQRKVRIFYDLFLDRLTEAQKQGVFGLVADQSKREESDGIAVPNTGYFHTGFLERMGYQSLPFRSYQTHLLVTFFGDPVELGPRDPFYLEIL